MSAELEFDDDLELSPEGQFLLAVGEAIQGLQIEPLETLKAAKVMMDFRDTAKPAINVSPLPERLLSDGAMGEFACQFQVGVMLSTKNGDSNTVNLGWHLKTRGEIVRRFAGHEGNTTELSRGGYCFHLGVQPGIRFDPNVFMHGVDAGFLIITGELYDRAG